MRALKYTFAVFVFALIGPGTLTAAATDESLTDNQKAMIYLMLSRTQESAIHQMRGATENKTFLHKDGHREAVYNADGNLVKDGINDGSYNHSHPVNDPFGHYSKDIEPWIIYGNSRKDPTSVDERLYAYMGDLERGIVRAGGLWAKASKYPQLFEKSQKDFPKAWTKILKHEDTHVIFDMIQSGEELSDAQLVSAMKALNKAFMDVY